MNTATRTLITDRASTNEKEYAKDRVPGAEGRTTLTSGQAQISHPNGLEVGFATCSVCYTQAEYTAMERAVIGARFRSWWQYIRKHWIVAIIIVLVVVITLIIAGYWFDWTGFNGYNKVTIAHVTSGTNAGSVTKTEEYQPGKALWDWLQLLIAPAVISFAGLWFIRIQQQRDKRLEQAQHDRDKKLADERTESERKAAEQKAELERDITLDNQRETALQAYIDKMSELLLHEKLRSSSEDDEVRKIARVRTLTILPRIDANRKRSVLLFLHESGLIDKDRSIIDLDGADLRNTDLSGADLNGAYLNEANLSGADLGGAGLHQADLSEADLRNTNLSGADLSGADLNGADLSNADLSGANLSNADLRNTNLEGAFLIGANLNGANLTEALVTPETQF